MGPKTKGGLALWPLLLGLLGSTQPIPAQTPSGQPEPAEPGFTVSGEVALSALLSLGDGYLTKMADSLEILAASDSVRTGEWERVREPLADLAERNVAALNWFALPDGSYWSVQEGRAKGNLSRRDQAGDAELAAAFEEMLSKEAGVIDYTFRNQKRTVAYRKSPVTGWWYAFGVVPPESDPGPKTE